MKVDTIELEIEGHTTRYVISYEIRDGDKQYFGLIPFVVFQELQQNFVSQNLVVSVIQVFEKVVKNNKEILYIRVDDEEIKEALWRRANEGI